jgi:hypothetical protein
MDVFKHSNKNFNENPPRRSLCVVVSLPTVCYFVCMMLSCCQKPGGITIKMMWSCSVLVTITAENVWGQNNIQEGLPVVVHM